MTDEIISRSMILGPIPVAARFKAWVYSRSLAGNEGFESHRVHRCLCVVNVVFCEVAFSASG